MKFEPRPEPSIHDREAHKQWEEEYEDWGFRRCNNGVGYFCREHGRWVACREVERRKAPARKDQTPGQCPERHYTDVIATEQSPKSLETCPTLATSSTSSIQDIDQNTLWMSSYDASGYINYPPQQQPSFPPYSYSTSEYPYYAEQDTTGGDSVAASSYPIQSSGFYQELTTDLASREISGPQAYGQPHFTLGAGDYGASQESPPASSLKQSLHASKDSDPTRFKSSTRQHGSGKVRSTEHHDSPGRHSSSKTEVKKGAADKGEVRRSEPQGHGVDASDNSSHRTHSRQGKGKESPSSHQPVPSAAYYATTTSHEYYSTQDVQAYPAESVSTATRGDSYLFRPDREGYLDQEYEPNKKKRERERRQP